MSSRPPRDDAGDHSGSGLSDEAADAERSHRRAVAAGIALTVLALTYTTSSLGDETRFWVTIVALGVAVLLPDALDTLRTSLPMPGLVPLALVGVLAPIYLCVPETDQIRTAAVIPIGVAAFELLLRRHAGMEWYALAAGSVAWAGLFGATGRQSALVGALFAWWIVGLLPIVSRIRPVRAQTPAVVIIATGGVAATVMARTGGISSSAGDAWIAAAIAGGASLVVGVVIAAVWSGDVNESTRATPRRRPG